MRFFEVSILVGCFSVMSLSHSQSEKDATPAGLNARDVSSKHISPDSKSVETGGPQDAADDMRSAIGEMEKWRAEGGDDFDQRLEKTSSLEEALELVERFERENDPLLNSNRIGPFYVERKLWQAAVAHWSKKDLKRTSEYVLALSGNNTNAMRGAVDTVAEQFRKDPISGMKWTMKVVNPELRNVALSEIVGRWFTTDEKVFLKWLEGFSPGSVKDAVIVEMIDWCLDDEQKPTALKWVEEIESESARKAARELMDKQPAVLILQ